MSRGKFFGWKSVAGASTSTSIVAYTGEIKYFKDKTTFDNGIKAKWNLVEGTHYKVIPSGKFIRVGNNGASGGSNNITNDNLPFKEWGFDVSDHYGRYASYTYMLSPDNFTNINMTSLTQNAAGDISYSGGQTIERMQLKWSIGAQTQQQFTPTYQEVYAIEILKDIEI